MSGMFDEAAVERAASGVSLRLPRGPHRGRIGDVRSASVGSSMELHDFRLYHPGDDVRHLDWNAVARTGELVIRVRQEEVAPRVEVVVDGSASMGITREKAARTREVAAWFCSAASRAGLEVVLVGLTTPAFRASGVAEVRARLSTLTTASTEPLNEALRRAPPLRPCGLRVVVSDFLVEAEPGALAERLAQRAAGTVFVQVLEADEVDPPVGVGARLTDSESGEVLERVLSASVVDGYLDRLAAHERQWQAAVRRVRGEWARVTSDHSIEALARRELAAFVEARA